jgi:hypothetical protein
MRFLFAALLVSLISAPAYALTKQKGGLTTSEMTVTGTVDMGTMVLDAPNRTLADFAKDYVDVPKGGTDWKLFGKTKEINVEGKDKQGYDFQYFKPGFPAALKALDGKEITVKGFMFPLGAVDKQKLFLFGPFPVSCPFHYHVSPALVLEVHADKAPIAFSYDAITLTGKLQLVSKDPENSTFYRLVDVTQVK